MELKDLTWLPKPIWLITSQKLRSLQILPAFIAFFPQSWYSQVCVHPLCPLGGEGWWVSEIGSKPLTKLLGIYCLSLGLSKFPFSVNFNTFLIPMTPYGSGEGQGMRTAVGIVWPPWTGLCLNSALTCCAWSLLTWFKLVTLWDLLTASTNGDSNISTEQDFSEIRWTHILKMS